MLATTNALSSTGGGDHSGLLALKAWIANEMGTLDDAVEMLTNHDRFLVTGHNEIQAAFDSLVHYLRKQSKGKEDRMRIVDAETSVNGGRNIPIHPRRHPPHRRGFQ